MLNQSLAVFNVALLLSSLNPALAADPAATPEMAKASVYQKWEGPLLDLKKSLKPGRNYVSWILVPPHTPLDMRSGYSFRRFFLATPADDFTIGHNLIAFHCTRKDGTLAEGGIAITGENDDQSTTMMKTGLGLTSLFSVFTDGALEGTKDVNQELIDEAKVHGQATVAFEVSGEACENMLGFVDAFAGNPSQPYKNFSNVLDPEKMQGGGCVTLARALLKRAGIFTNVIPNFQRPFVLNRNILGGNIPLPKNVKTPNWPWLKGRPHKVPPILVMAKPWDGDDRRDIPLKLMDPEVMLYSLRALSLEYLRTVPAAERVAEDKRIGASAFGPRSVKLSSGSLLSYHNGVIKRHETIAINDSFDENFAEAAKQARAWLAEAEHEGFEIHRGANLMKSPVLVVDRP